MPAEHHLGHHHYMVFHGGNHEQILWPGWMISDIAEFAFAALALFLLAFFYEALKFLSQQLLKKSTARGTNVAKMSTKVKQSCSEAPLTGPQRNGYWHEITTKVHIVQTLLYAVQVMISYVLMLVFMNFNYWLCLAVIAGLSLGYFGFGWTRGINFVTECCN